MEITETHRSNQIGLKDNIDSLEREGLDYGVLFDDEGNLWLERFGVDDDSGVVVTDVY